LIIAGALAASASSVAAQDFRIDTEVFIGPLDKKDKDKEPAAETLTIFTNGMVYDFLLAEPREITLFDPLRGRFTLLDESRKLKTSLGTQEVLDYVLALDSFAEESKDPVFSFATHPTFEHQSESMTQNGQSLIKLTLTGKPMTYVALCQRPEHPESVVPYHTFADWFARLNAARPGNLPPGARMALNKAMADQGLLPLEVTRTIVSSGSFGREKKVEVKTRHLVNWTLSGEDRKRVEHAGDCLVQFRPVTFDEYRTETKPAAAPKQARR
jgi:hypothetical protein